MAWGIGTGGRGADIANGSANLWFGGSAAIIAPAFCSTPDSQPLAENRSRPASKFLDIAHRSCAEDSAVPAFASRVRLLALICAVSTSTAPLTLHAAETAPPAAADGQTMRKIMVSDAETGPYTVESS